MISYYIVHLKRQNRLKVGTDKPKLKVKMQSVSDDDVQKDFLKSHVLSRRRKVYSDWKDVTASGRAFLGLFGPATEKVQLSTVDSLTSGTRRRLVPVERSDHLPGRLRTGTSITEVTRDGPKSGRHRTSAEGFG